MLNRVLAHVDAVQPIGSCSVETLNRVLAHMDAVQPVGSCSAGTLNLLRQTKSHSPCVARPACCGLHGPHKALGRAQAIVLEVVAVVPFEDVPHSCLVQEPLLAADGSADGGEEVRRLAAPYTLTYRQLFSGDAEPCPCPHGCGSTCWQLFSGDAEPPTENQKPFTLRGLTGMLRPPWPTQSPWPCAGHCLGSGCRRSIRGCSSLLPRPRAAAGGGWQCRWW